MEEHSKIEVNSIYKDKPRINLGLFFMEQIVFLKRL